MVMSDGNEVETMNYTPKMDRQGARTPAALDRQYNIGGNLLSLNKTISKQKQTSNQTNTELAELIKELDQFVEDANAKLLECEQFKTEANARIAELEQNMIKTNAVGSVLSLDDASGYKLNGLKIYGKSTQIGTPTDIDPIPIDTAGASGSITVMITSEAEGGSQWLQINTLYGLAGIPVASGGNYVDENGQAWICDEIDFSLGLYIHRIGKIASYNGEDIGTVYMASTGSLRSGAEVIYVHSTPGATPLSESELKAYANLHTYRGDTTIRNDAQCCMNVGYVADTTAYINKLRGDA